MATNAEDASVSGKRGIVRPRVRSRFPIPSERFPFQTHFEVLRQFVVRTKHGAEPVGAASIEGGTVPKQAASLNVPFLTGIGLLAEVKGKYVPTEAADRFVTTLNVSEDRARGVLRPVVEGSWFGQFARDWFAIHAVTPEDEFVRELALYADLSDLRKKERSLKLLVAYLTYTQAVAKDNDGNLTSGSAAPSSAPPLVVTTAPPASPRDPRSGPSVTPPEGPVDWHTIQTDDFYVKVRSDPDALADLRDHLDLLEKKIGRLRSRKPATTPEEKQDETPA